MKQARFETLIGIEHLYNIPAPYLVLSFIASNINTISIAERQYEEKTTDSQYPYNSRTTKNEVNGYSSCHTLLFILNTLFKRNEPILLNSSNINSPAINGRGIEYSKLLSEIHSVLSIEKELDLLFKKLEKINITKNDFKVRIPKQMGRPEGMSENQYSDFVLGYRVLANYFEKYINIEYY